MKSCICKASEAIEERAFQSAAADGTIDSPIMDAEARYILESLKLNSFENALNLFEEFFSNIQFFCGETHFLKAAHSLDLAAAAFREIEGSNSSMLKNAHLDAYIAGMENPQIAESLKWLSENFGTLQSLCFFEDGISHLEIEGARDVFYGLSFLQEQQEKPPSRKTPVTDKVVADFLEAHGEHLDPRHTRGLGALVTYLDRLHLALPRVNQATA